MLLSHLSHFLFPAAPTSWPPPAIPHVLSLLLSMCSEPREGRGLLPAKQGSGVQTFHYLPSPWDKHICWKSIHSLISQNICNHVTHISINVVVPQMFSLWIRPRWGYHIHFEDRVAKAQRRKVTCPETHSR